MHIKKESAKLEAQEIRANYGVIPVDYTVVDEPINNDLIERMTYGLLSGRYNDFKAILDEFGITESEYKKLLSNSAFSRKLMEQQYEAMSTVGVYRATIDLIKHSVRSTAASVKILEIFGKDKKENGKPTITTASELLTGGWDKKDTDERLNPSNVERSGDVPISSEEQGRNEGKFSA